MKSGPRTSYQILSGSGVCLGILAAGDSVALTLAESLERNESSW